MGVLECQTCVATTKMFLKSGGDIHENDVRTGKNKQKNIGVPEIRRDDFCCSWENDMNTGSIGSKYTTLVGVWIAGSEIMAMGIDGNEVNMAIGKCRTTF